MNLLVAMEALSHRQNSKCLGFRNARQVPTSRQTLFGCILALFCFWSFTGGAKAQIVSADPSVEYEQAQSHCDAGNDIHCYDAYHLGEQLGFNDDRLLGIAEQGCHAGSGDLCYLVGLSHLRGDLYLEKSDELALFSFARGCGREIHEPISCEALGDIFARETSMGRSLSHARGIYDFACAYAPSDSCAKAIISSLILHKEESDRDDQLGLPSEFENATSEIIDLCVFTGVPLACTALLVTSETWAKLGFEEAEILTPSAEGRHDILVSYRSSVCLQHGEEISVCSLSEWELHRSLANSLSKLSVFGLDVADQIRHHNLRAVDLGQRHHEERLPILRP